MDARKRKADDRLDLTQSYDGQFTTEQVILTQFRALLKKGVHQKKALAELWDKHPFLKDWYRGKLKLSKDLSSDATEAEIIPDSQLFDDFASAIKSAQSSIPVFMLENNPRLRSAISEDNLHRDDPNNTFNVFHFRDCIASSATYRHPQLLRQLLQLNPKEKAFFYGFAVNINGSLVQIQDQDLIENFLILLRGQDRESLLTMFAQNARLQNLLKALSFEDLKQTILLTLNIQSRSLSNFGYVYLGFIKDNIPGAEHLFYAVIKSYGPYNQLLPARKYRVHFLADLIREINPALVIDKNKAPEQSAPAPARPTVQPLLFLPAGKPAATTPTLIDNKYFEYLHAEFLKALVENKNYARALWSLMPVLESYFRGETIALNINGFVVNKKMNARGFVTTIYPILKSQLDDIILPVCEKNPYYASWFCGHGYQQIPNVLLTNFVSAVKSQNSTALKMIWDNNQQLHQAVINLDPQRKEQISNLLLSTCTFDTEYITAEFMNVAYNSGMQNTAYKKG